MNSDNLQTTLNTLLQSGAQSNPALNYLINDYIIYHAVLIVVGGLFTVILVVLSFLFWTRYKRVSKTAFRRWTFEQKIYVGFSLLTIAVGLLMAFVVVVNTGTALNPRPGFSGVVDMLGPSSASAYKAELHQSFNAWLQSGSPQVPDFIQGKINDRFAWQRPKAMICSVLLAGFVALSVQIWSTLIRRSKMGEAKRKLNEKALLFSGVVLVPVCFLLMVMVIGNTQALIAPMSLTLVFGYIG